jgi:uncharacterized protein YcsI (UPF0317 family)
MHVMGRECVPSGTFAGPMVVSMRPYLADEIPLVVAISGRYPTMHGAPVHVEDSGSLGVRDLEAPEFGGPISIEDQISGFWACEVTPQEVVKKAAACDNGQPWAHVHCRTAWTRSTRFDTMVPTGV